MSYIEKEKLIKADIASIENRVRHAFNQGYDLGFKDGKERAKTLEQEPCEDAISRQEVLDLMADYDLTMGQVVRVIHALPSVTPQEPRWIPVSEKLPEKDEDYLVTIELTFSRGDTYVSILSLDIWDSYKILGHEVIAWMQLPKPYKIESEDKE